MAAHAHAHSHDHHHDDIVYPATIPFILVHLACLGAIWSGVTVEAVIIAVVLYFVRMWALTAGFHRYFSHRSYKTSRAFQFFLALLGQTSAQKGVLWWSATHRHHHRHSDTPEDVHSPRHHGFLFAHVGWIFSPSKNKPDYDTVSDLRKYPELRFLDRHPYFPAVLLAIGTYWMAGWPGLFVGFFCSTVVLYHCVFMINSLAHGIGSQKYVTGDDSRNNWLLALITLGEGWHNNHHHYQSSTRQGWHWWQVDISYYVLKALSWVGLVWDLRAPPAEVVRGEQRLGRKVVEKVAWDLAHSFNIDAISEQIQEAWASKPTLMELRERAARTRSQAHALLAEVHLPHVPTLEELKHRAEEMFEETPSVDDIAERAREILLQAISVRLLDEPAAG